MKTTILAFLSLGGLLLLSNCTTVVSPDPTTQTTVTEETTNFRPSSTTVETQTTRSY